MKKIMALTAAIMVAAATQAAAVCWTATNVYVGNATDKAAGIAYFMVSDTAYTTLTAGGLDVDGVTTAIGSAYSYTPVAAGTYSVSSANPVANATLGLADSSNYNAYLVIFDGATIADSTQYYVTAAKNLGTSAGDSNASIAFGTQKTLSQNAANWTAIETIPEPTSGLLMLLGMAGLALRRRRA